MEPTQTQYMAAALRHLKEAVVICGAKLPKKERDQLDLLLSQVDVCADRCDEPSPNGSLPHGM